MRSIKILKDLISYEKIHLSPKIQKTKGPYKLVRAKTLGYKNTPQYVSYLGSIKKGGIEARPTKKGRKPVNQCRKYSRDISNRQIVINRVSKGKKNLKLVGCYLLKKDKLRKYYELIFRDKNFKATGI